MPNWNMTTMYLQPTNVLEIRKTLWSYVFHNLSNKAGGVDNISSKTLKLLIEYISLPLFSIYVF